jgi:hypothetical protein
VPANITCRRGHTAAQALRINEGQMKDKFGLDYARAAELAVSCFAGPSPE